MHVFDDPLTSFDFKKIRESYDARVEGYSNYHKVLTNNGITGISERELYIYILDEISKDLSQKGQLTLQTYQLFYYWSRYWQDGGVIPSHKLPELSNRLHALEINGFREATDGLELLRYAARLICCGIYGLDGFGLSLKSTFLHFIRPDLFSILDKKIYRAFGVTDRADWQKTTIKLNDPYARQIVQRLNTMRVTYATKLSDAAPDVTIIRGLDMALRAQ